MDSGHSTIATAAGLIARTLTDYGCDCAPLFERAGLDRALAADPSARYPSRKMQALWRLALKSTGDPCFGISVAERMQPADMYGLGFAWLASDTLLDALERLIRYQRALSTAARFSLEPAGDEVRLVLDALIPGTTVAHATLDMIMAAAVRMCRLTCGRDFEPARVTMRRPRPDCEERFERFFGTRVLFGAPQNLICFDHAALRKPLPHASPELARANDRVVIEYLERFDRSRISMRARAWIIEQLPSGHPSQARLAQSLNMSVRSLQRKLLEENTSFKMLLDETRRELAKQYIREAHRPIGEITFLLGFSEASNFTRAFRRWMGVSPNAYRQVA
jgi:AraC-like DNA-binding protein